MTGLVGAVRFLAFLVALMLAAWCINVYRHIRAGGWKGFSAVVDISGVVILAGALIALIMPLLR